LKKNMEKKLKVKKFHFFSHNTLIDSSPYIPQFLFEKLNCGSRRSAKTRLATVLKVSCRWGKKSTSGCRRSNKLLHFPGFCEIGRLQTSDLKSDVVSWLLFPPFFESRPLPSREMFKPRSDVSSTETSDERSDIELNLSPISTKRRGLISKNVTEKGGERGIWKLGSDPLWRAALRLKPLRLLQPLPLGPKNDISPQFGRELSARGGSGAKAPMLAARPAPA